MSNAAAKIAQNNLPDVLMVAFRAGGWKAVRGLVKAFGGKRFRIPKFAVGDNHPLVVAAGRAAADAIVKRYGDSKNFHFPRGGHSLKLMLIRDAMLATAEEERPSLNELAGLLECTYSHACFLLREAKASKQTAPVMPMPLAPTPLEAWLAGEKSHRP